MKKHSLAKVAFLALLIVCVPRTAEPFAGEDFIKGNPWHHEAITEDALHAKSFGEASLQEIAWNADYVDSYLYNPLWWIQGGLSRFKVSLASYDELARVHFDDNFSSDHVRRTWRRYLSGAMAGLVWAAERNDIAGARNVLGVSLHAVQDFYSHSNWIDAPERRETTWFEFATAQREKTAIYVGAYELPPQVGVKPHGKIDPSCSILRIGLLKPFLEPGCTAFSPLHNSRVCDLYEECKSGTPIQPSLYGERIPENVLYASPPGMNLDARWSSNIGVRTRGLTDLTGAKAFDIARGLAEKASEQWVGIVEEKLEKLGYGAFWKQVKNAPDTAMKEKQYENYDRFPYQFISAGTYPPDLRTPEKEWYLRVQIRTGADSGAGTDSDIYLESAGKRFLLDYMPRANPLIAYNDFEQSDNQVYTVGPFGSLPEKFSLYNDSAEAPDVMRALNQTFINGMKTVVDTVGDTLLSLVAGHADKIGTTRKVFSPEELAAVTATGTSFVLPVNGGDEGYYRVEATIFKTAQSPGNGPEDWAEYRVTLRNIYCIREGSVDRLSPSDEPYVLAILVPFPGGIMKYRTSPFPDTDTGETKRIGYSFPTVRLPKRYGMLSVPISIWEHDSESDQSRREQLNRFAGEAEQRTAASERSLTDAIGAAIAAKWKVASVSAYAFCRGGVLKAGRVYDESINAWINGKERRTFQLNAANVKTFGAVDAATIDILPHKIDLSGEWESGFGGKVKIEQTGSDVRLTNQAGLLFTGKLEDSELKLSHRYVSESEVPGRLPLEVKKQLIGSVVRIEGTVSEDEKTVDAKVISEAVTFDPRTNAITSRKPTSTSVVFKRIPPELSISKFLIGFDWY